MSYFLNFTVETGKTILGDIIKTCNHSENSKRLSEAKAAAGKEMLMMMHLVFPQVMQIQIDIIKNYGFPGNREGLIQFEQLIREFEKDDPEVARLRAQIRAIYLPPITINPANDILIWEVGQPVSRSRLHLIHSIHHFFAEHLDWLTWTMHSIACNTKTATIIMIYWFRVRLRYSLRQ